MQLLENAGPVLCRKPIAALLRRGTEHASSIFGSAGPEMNFSVNYDLVVDRLRPVMFSRDSSESAKV